VLHGRLAMRPLFQAAIAADLIPFVASKEWGLLFFHGHTAFIVAHTAPMCIDRKFFS